MSEKSSLNLNSDIIRYEEIDGDMSTEWDINSKQLPQTAHDWEGYKQSNVFDDGTQTYFWYIFYI
jgi:hypothetical protein